MNSKSQRMSWAIKDQAILHELVTLMQLTPHEAAIMGSLEDAARLLAPSMASTFYQRLLARPETSEYLAGKPLDRLHGTISDWFVGIFSGTYDEAYASERLRIGAMHVKIGLPVRYPLAMMDVVLEYGQQVARQHVQREVALNAFNKVLTLDLALFNQAYEDNQLKHLAELVGGERLARVVLTGITR